MNVAVSAFDDPLPGRFAADFVAGAGSAPHSSGGVTGAARAVGVFFVVEGDVLSATLVPNNASARSQLRVSMMNAASASLMYRAL